MKKFLVLILLLMSLCIPISVQAEEDTLKLAEKAGSAILIEATSGKVIYEKNADEKLPPASMTKMMSMLLIIEKIDSGHIKWDDKVTVSENASSMGGSQILLETGEKMSVSDLFKGVAVASGNDAVVALAEYTYGSEANFVNAMNKKAKELGLKNTSFKNPHGLDAANHYSSARDMALIAMELSKHPDVFNYTSIYEDYLRKDTDRKIWLVNTNKLVRFYDGVDGMKTGYTEEARYCLTATAKKNGMRLIAVAMNEPDSNTRNSEVTNMLNYGFSNYYAESIITTKTNLGKVEVIKGKDKYVTIVPKENVSIINDKSKDKIIANYEVKIDDVVAPVKKGDKVGTLILKEDGVKTKEIDLTVKNDVKKANFIELYSRYLKDMLAGEISFKA